MSGATFYDCINTIYQFIKPFLDSTMSVFEESGAFKKPTDLDMHCLSFSMYILFSIYFQKVIITEFDLENFRIKSKG